uniref:AN1-type domain-containing protein n=1 Tax=Ditylenchus dipsaci TaxID=166011 RepID=A0A915E7R4_9BILA
MLLLSKNALQENQTVQEVPLATATFTPMRTRTTPSSKTNARCYKCPKNSRFHCSVCQKPACNDHRSIQNPKHCAQDTDGCEDDQIHCFKPDGPVPSGRFKLQQAREDKELAELIEEIDLEQQEENVENDSNVSLECY